MKYIYFLHLTGPKFWRQSVFDPSFTRLSVIVAVVAAVVIVVVDVDVNVDVVAKLSSSWQLKFHLN